MRDANAALIEAYRHDASGNRLGKHSGPDTIRYLYDRSGTLLGEYDGNGQSLAEYLYLDHLPVAVFTATGLGYIETDHLGAPRILIDAASNQAQWHWPLTGSAFGDHAPDQDPQNTGNPYTFNLRYPGQYFDQETGLHYNYFRDYEPQTGRYIQSDPIGLRGGVSTYGYGLQNPFNYTDPTGEAAICAAGPWGAGACTCAAAISWGIRIYRSYRLASAASSVMNACRGNNISQEYQCSDDDENCEKEWEDAYSECSKYISQQSPPQGVTGGYRNLHDCARGLVSERCGGNPIDHGLDFDL